MVGPSKEYLRSYAALRIGRLLLAFLFFFSCTAPVSAQYQCKYRGEQRTEYIRQFFQQTILRLNRLGLSISRQQEQFSISDGEEAASIEIMRELSDNINNIWLLLKKECAIMRSSPKLQKRSRCARGERSMQIFCARAPDLIPAVQSSNPAENVAARLLQASQLSSKFFARMSDLRREILSDNRAPLEYDADLKSQAYRFLACRKAKRSGAVQSPSVLSQIRENVDALTSLGFTETKEPFELISSAGCDEGQKQIAELRGTDLEQKVAAVLDVMSSKYACFTQNYFGAIPVSRTNELPSSIPALTKICLESAAAGDSRAHEVLRDTEIERPSLVSSTPSTAALAITSITEGEIPIGEKGYNATELVREGSGLGLTEPNRSLPLNSAPADIGQVTKYNGSTFVNRLEDLFIAGANSYETPRDPIESVELVWRTDSTALEREILYDAYLRYQSGKTSPAAKDEIDWQLFDENGSETPEQVGISYENNAIKLFPWGDKNVGKKFQLFVRHRPSGFSAHALTPVIQAVKDFRIPTEPFTGPATSLKQKADDPLCTPEKRAAAAFAGGDGSEDNPFLICGGAQLIGIKSLISAQSTKRGTAVKLMANVDFADSQNMKPIPVEWLSSFDGNDYAISNYRIEDAEASEQGLFTGTISRVMNLNIINPLVQGRTNVGSLFGITFNRTDYSRVRIFGGKIAGREAVGGIVGNSKYTSSFDLCYVKDAAINVQSMYGGGIAGRAFYARIIDSLVETVISGIGTPGSQSYLGGLAGELTGSNSNFFDNPQNDPQTPGIFRSAFRGSIVANNDTSGAAYIGGLTGVSAIPILNSVVEATIVGTGAYVGGISGYRGDNEVGCNRYTLSCVMARVSFTGTIIGAKGSADFSSVGGLVGYLSGGLIVDSLVRGTVSGKRGVGGVIGNSDQLSRIVRTSTVGLTTSSENPHGGFIGDLIIQMQRFDNGLEFLSDGVFLDNYWTSAGSAGIFDISYRWNPDGSQTSAIDLDGIHSR